MRMESQRAGAAAKTDRRTHAGSGPPARTKVDGDDRCQTRPAAVYVVLWGPPGRPTTHVEAKKIC